MNWRPLCSVAQIALVVMWLTVDALDIASNDNTKLAKIRHNRRAVNNEENNGFRPRISPFPDERRSNDQPDNHFPKFLKCGSYKPHIKEDQPTGTHVIKVEAYDPDPPDRGGKITYQFVADSTEQSKFHIDAHTGEITTKYMFNRDEPTREKEIYVIVRATDNGRPELDAVCVFTVIIEDINDNPPTFDKVIYRESIPLDTKINTEIMRIVATDIDDGLNKEIEYAILSGQGTDSSYFSVNKATGSVSLTKTIDKKPNYVFKIEASATDKSPTDPKSVNVHLEITVIESDKVAPIFVDDQPNIVTLKEDFNSPTAHIAELEARSNTDEPAPIFTLVSGKSEQTNKKDTFVLKTDGVRAYILLGASSLDYEVVKEYILTVRIENKYNLAAERTITVKLEDVNDNAPKFKKEVSSGQVLENEDPNTPVMQVSAIDEDETPEFKKITYELQDFKDLFAIDPDSGLITTKVKFDREERNVYNVKVIAKDGAPSAILKNGEPNTGEQVFRINIADKNDHKPTFRQKILFAVISEDIDVNSLVIEVQAEDEDDASSITYSIVSGNDDNAFIIEPGTGRIKTHKKLDYEKIIGYKLNVQADDGLFRDDCSVEIKIINVNDELPQFEIINSDIKIEEEKLLTDCIVTVIAYDPDIANRDEPQNIVYSLLRPEQQHYFKINSSGCLTLVKPLDRDPPDGQQKWQVLVKANDEGGVGPLTKSNVTSVLITVIDINDNAPTLNMSEPVVWLENRPPGLITKLTAIDNDGPGNGEPFFFRLAEEASADIREKFAVTDSYLEALQTFDREEQKEYIVPIWIKDSGNPPCDGVSYLKVIIGDENDVEMKEGTSSIFVYYLENGNYDVVIGHVYVEDADDWDLPDKVFEWESYDEKPSSFDLNKQTGGITMSKVAPKTYYLRFKVTEDPKSRKFPRHSVMATVNVTVKEIPEEAIHKSGSIRFGGVTAEEFITKNKDGKSKADILKSQLAIALNNSEENIDVFTILHSPLHYDKSQLDVRFSSHGSPYYAAERINAAVIGHQDEMENQLKAKMMMINVDECLIEKANCEASCYSFLNFSNVPAAVFTNTTSFVGIQAYADFSCQCKVETLTCFNGTVPTGDGGCSCPIGFDGTYCEQDSIGFSGDGWALYPTLNVCNETKISLYVRTHVKDGLIFYIGPESTRPDPLGVQDFMALAVRRGYPMLLVDYGTGTTKVDHFNNFIDDNKFHKIDIILRPTGIQLIVDDCSSQKCLNLAPPVGTNKYLNVNGPLQVGGVYMNLDEVDRPWEHKPFATGFHGCIQNFTVNGKPYNLGSPSLSHNPYFGCSKVIAENVVFSFNRTFLVAILMCLAVLALLFMAVVVHRRKVEDMYRDTDDIRENIINYEDEGGGEGDMTGYDLSVLRLHCDEPIGAKYMNGMLPSTGADEVPDICGFLDDKKHSVDNDPETLPFDDVRHYAYEGDGNTTGSLSSLASGTDEGDLNFDYLSNFGPRFRKLADMYGEDASDEDSDTYHNAASESWC